jgi:signal transduction histidine kinase
MSLQPCRTPTLVTLLVVMPVALLAWLGSHLLRDAARATEQAREAILKERLHVAAHQLVDDLRQLTDDLDGLGQAAGAAELSPSEALAKHPWVAELWSADSSGPIQPEMDPKRFQPNAEAMAAVRSAALWKQLEAVGLMAGLPSSATDQPFIPLGEVSEGPLSSPLSVWQTAVKQSRYHLGHEETGAAPAFLSGWHNSDGDFIYWRLLGERLLCARLDSTAVRQALFARLPIPGLQNYPGQMTLATVTGIPLHRWGQARAGSDGHPVASLRCFVPLSQWQLAYTPASEEFPKPYLAPILLGVGSGCLLVVALAWTFFRENAREIRVAQQRVSFVNQISHELKTPLTNIRLYAEMASSRMEHSGDSISRRHLGVVETEVARLDRLIQNVLNYSRQQRDKLTVQPRPISLDHVVQRAVNHWRLLLERKGFDVRTRLVGPSEMKADPDAIEQILGNLISNVEKYAGYGKYIHVATEQDLDKQVARIIVEDRGPGIPQSKRRLVFEPFERLRSDLNEGVTGTGIGLTISRELAELHGGRLDLCPNYREGARFIVTLPFEPPPPVKR